MVQVFYICTIKERDTQTDIYNRTILELPMLAI